MLALAGGRLEALAEAAGRRRRLVAATGGLAAVAGELTLRRTCVVVVAVRCGMGA